VENAVRIANNMATKTIVCETVEHYARKITSL